MYLTSPECCFLVCSFATKTQESKRRDFISLKKHVFTFNSRFGLITGLGTDNKGTFQNILKLMTYNNPRTVTLYASEVIRGTS